MELAKKKAMEKGQSVEICLTMVTSFYKTDSAHYNATMNQYSIRLNVTFYFNIIFGEYKFDTNVDRKSWTKLLFFIDINFSDIEL